MGQGQDVVCKNEKGKSKQELHTFEEEKLLTTWAKASSKTIALVLK